MEVHIQAPLQVPKQEYNEYGDPVGIPLWVQRQEMAKRQPPPKIRGTQWRQRQEKVRQKPPPQKHRIRRKK